MDDWSQKLVVTDKDEITDYAETFAKEMQDLLDAGFESDQNNILDRLDKAFDKLKEKEKKADEKLNNKDWY